MNNKGGRPPLDEKEASVRLNVTVTESQAEWLKEYGFGNISLGVRRLVDEKREPKEEVVLQG